MKKILLIVVFLFFSIDSAMCTLAQEAEQTIADFNLSGFGEKGKKTWELSGKSADIFSDIVKLKDIMGKLYGKEEDITLTAQEGSFDRKKALVHLEKDVTITTSSGAKLMTDSLDWDRRNQLVSTNDTVNIEKEDMTTKAQGAKGQVDLNKISLEKDVVVKINPPQEEGKESSSRNKIIITCDGPLEIDYQKNIAVFKNNVKVEQKDFIIFSDTMHVYFTKIDKGEASASAETASVMGVSLDKIVSKGNVKIIRGENISYSDEAVYTASDKKVVLTGRPKLIIYSSEDFNASSGN